MQTELFDPKPAVRAPFDVSVYASEFAHTLYDLDGQASVENLYFRVELYTRELLAQVGVK
jgi:hypothetical protein